MRDYYIIRFWFNGIIFESCQMVLRDAERTAESMKNSGYINIQIINQILK